MALQISGKSALKWANYVLPGTVLGVMDNMMNPEMTVFTENPVLLLGLLAAVFVMVKFAVKMAFKLLIIGFLAFGAWSFTADEPVSTANDVEVTAERTGPLAGINGLSNEELKELATPPKYMQDAASGAIDYLKSDEVGEAAGELLDGLKDTFGGLLGD